MSLGNHLPVHAFAPFIIAFERQFAQMQQSTPAKFCLQALIFQRLSSNPAA
jgi:hypothetical protein